MLLDGIRTAWRHAVHALNAAENSGLDDTAIELALIGTSLSQVLELEETMSSENSGGV